MKKIELSNKKRVRTLLILVLIGVLVLIVIMCFIKKKQKDTNPPSKLFHIALADAILLPGNYVTVDVIAGNFPGIYPAVSFELKFDPTQLEFIQLKQGNITIENQTMSSKILPEWSYEAALANRDGLIRTMYLDMTAGNAALQFEHLPEGKDVLFRIEFKVRDSCSKGETIPITFSQATFATIDESNSISIQKNNIVCKDGMYIVP